MLFNLTEFLMSICFTLDFVELDLAGVTSNHSKRVSYISFKIGENLGLNKKELYDITALAILHDNGASEKILHNILLGKNIESLTQIEHKKEHCTIGERNISSFPFNSNVKNVILYHHENFDGTGFFNVVGNDIPLMSQIIHLADILDLNFNLKNLNGSDHDKLLTFINNSRNTIFSDEIVNAFIIVSSHKSFWLDLKNMFITTTLKNIIPQFSIECSYKEIRPMTKILSKIIDCKSPYTQLHSSELAIKVEKMCNYYGYTEEDTFKMIIAADLHDIGKLAVPNFILDNKGKLTYDEYEIIKEHPYYTRIALQEIKGFEDIVEWASNHHEKLNGKGYPFGKNNSELDFNSRLMACVDIYQALTEARPYRPCLTHNEAMNILDHMKDDIFIDSKIIEDIQLVFKIN